MPKNPGIPPRIHTPRILAVIPHLGTYAVMRDATIVARGSYLDTPYPTNDEIRESVLLVLAQADLPLVIGVESHPGAMGRVMPTPWFFELRRQARRHHIPMRHIPREEWTTGHYVSGEFVATRFAQYLRRQYLRDPESLLY